MHAVALVFSTRVRIDTEPWPANLNSVWISVMFSFESSRSKAYSKDIRWRMIYQKCSLGLTYAQIATNMNVDPSTVCRTVQLLEQTGTVESIHGYHEKTTKRLTSTDELVLMEAIVNQPSIYQHAWTSEYSVANYGYYHMLISHSQVPFLSRFYSQKALT